MFDNFLSKYLLIEQFDDYLLCKVNNSLKSKIKISSFQLFIGDTVYKKYHSSELEYRIPIYSSGRYKVRVVYKDIHDELKWYHSKDEYSFTINESKGMVDIADLNDRSLEHMYNELSKKVAIKNFGLNNEIIIKTNLQNVKRISIQIDGNNNKIILEKGGTNVDLSIHTKGNNNLTYLGENYRTIKSNMLLFGDNQYIKIGKNAHFGGVGLNAQENTSIEIGDDALFSYGVEIRTTDSHSILDLNTKVRINPAANIKIGNHVWGGTQVLISKGVTIVDDVIIGAKALVVKSILKSHVAIGGVPAKIIKEGITWDLDKK